VGVGAFFMAGKHLRFQCPLCRMICAPGRLDVPPAPICFQTVEYQSAGRGRGRYHWEDAPDSAESRCVLLALQFRLEQALVDVELALGVHGLPLALPPLSVDLDVARAVRLSPFRRHRFSLARHALIAPNRV